MGRIRKNRMEAEGARGARNAKPGEEGILNANATATDLMERILDGDNPNTRGGAGGRRGRFRLLPDLLKNRVENSLKNREKNAFLARAFLG